MEELSIEEMATRYNEALEKARQLCAYPTTQPFISDLQDIFPELAESEDERIRKFLKRIIGEWSYDDLSANGFRKEDIIAYLEKQGEQESRRITSAETKEALYDKPDNHTYLFEDMYEASKQCYDSKYNKDEYCHEQSFKWGFQEGAEWREEKAKQEWSEEDEYHKRQILRNLKNSGCSQTLQEKTEKWIEERLKSLRPQWKPSEEQIRELGIVATGKGWFSKEILSELLEQLKKLKE